MHTLSCHHSHIRPEGKENLCWNETIANLLRNVPETSTTASGQRLFTADIYCILTETLKFYFSLCILSVLKS